MSRKLNAPAYLNQALKQLNKSNQENHKPYSTHQSKAFLRIVSCKMKSDESRNNSSAN